MDEVVVEIDDGHPPVVDDNLVRSYLSFVVQLLQDLKDEIAELAQAGHAVDGELEERLAAARDCAADMERAMALDAGDRL